MAINNYYGLFFFRSSSLKVILQSQKIYRLLYLRDKKKKWQHKVDYVFPKDYAGWINSTVSVSKVVSCVLTVYCIGSSFHNG